MDMAEMIKRIDESTVCKEQELTVREKTEVKQYLIDAEIARQPTSEAVQAAKDWVKNTRPGNVYMSGSWIAQMREEITREIQQTILDALRQLTEPTDEAVKDALEKLTYSRELDREFDDGTFVTALDTAIYALRHMKPKKCDMCESWAAWSELNCPKTIGVPWKFTNCPSCGRGLR